MARARLFSVAGLLCLSGVLGRRVDSAGGDVDAFHYRAAMDRGVGLCVEPDNPTVLQGGDAKWEELVWSKMDKGTPLRTDAWGNNPWGKSWMPAHMMLGLVRDDAKYPPERPQHGNVGLDSECFLVDYNGTGPDPAGCRAFSKSFAPLKQLRNCIVGHLDRDPIWSTRETAQVVDKKSNFSGAYREWCRKAIWSYVGGGTLPVQLCGAYDTIRRAEEMVKFVLFKPLPDDPAAAAQKVRSKAQFTVTWPKGQDSIAADTALAIQEQCFEVREGQSLARAGFLQRVSPCLPLMFDKAEIQGFGINDGIMKFQDTRFYGNEEQDLKQRAALPVPPLCGRLALATIPGFQSSSYTIATWSSLQNDQKPSFTECLNVEATNCRKAYYCWEAALTRMCGISPNCCNQDHGPDEAAKTHKACADNPDGQLVNTGMDLRILPESIPFVGVRRRCPREMGTGRI